MQILDLNPSIALLIKGLLKNTLKILARDILQKNHFIALKNRLFQERILTPKNKRIPMH